MEIINAILHLDLCPWLDKNNKSDDFYSSAFRLIPLLKEEYNPRYITDFCVTAFSIKIKYYQRLIDNSVIDFLNKSLVETNEYSQNLLAYELSKANDKVKSLLIEINELVVLRQYNLNLIASKVNDYTTDRVCKEATYILHYMLTTLIKCYLEIQHHFSSYIHADNTMSIADIYGCILNKPLPENTHIREMQIASNVVPMKTINVQLNDAITHSFTYSKLNTESTNIRELFNSLKFIQCIAEDTNFTDFKRVFSGMLVATPIRWVGPKSDLSYLIKLLNHRFKVLSFPGNSVWKIVCECFVDKNEERFTEQSLRDQKQPKLTKENILKAAKLMK